MVHSFRFSDLYLILDVESGALHAVDKLTYDLLPFYGTETANIIRLFPQYAPNDIEEALCDLTALESRGELNAAVSGIPEMGDPVIKALCLHVAHDCNLRCDYCFASTGDFHTGRALMPFEVGKAALDFLVAKSGNRNNLEVDFFGGEPLMNFDVVKRLTAYGRTLEVTAGKSIHFTLTTNGVALDEDATEFCNREMFNVVLSLDGRKSIHDTVRKTVNGKGSYDVVYDNILRTARLRQEQGFSHYVRGTFTHNNLDFSRDVLFLADLGFKQLSIEPVVLPSDSPLSLKEEDLPAIFSEYEILTKEYVSRRQNDRWFNFFHFMVDLKNAPCLGKRIKGCGAGDEYIAVTPEGDIYPCHQFVGGPFKMGNVLTGEFAETLRTQFRESNLSTKPACRNCWAKYFCSGGCAANSYNSNGDINSPYTLACEMQKKRLECALYVYAAELLADKSENPLRSL